MDFFKLSKIKRPEEGKIKHAYQRFFLFYKQRIPKINTKHSIIAIIQFDFVENSLRLLYQKEGSMVFSSVFR